MKTTNFETNFYHFLQKKKNKIFLKQFKLIY
jgi:hypothetical protein